jgi:hypothetical protein
MTKTAGLLSEEKVLRRESNLSNGTTIICEAKYRKACWGDWIMTHWRIDAGTGHGFSEWHKVHGNQKRTVQASNWSLMGSSLNLRPYQRSEL